jgi:spore coat protein U-like protein
MRKNVIAPIAAGILLGAAGPASAFTATTTFTVSAAVVSNCSVDADDMNFGSYDASADLTSSADIDVSCSIDIPYTVSLSAGSSGDFATRTMANGANTLAYNLYLDTTHSTIWNETNVASGIGEGMSVGNEDTHTVYGLLPNTAANQDAPVGNYSDLITVTVTY